MNDRYDYDAACRRAATNQGLDPIVSRLRAERIPAQIEQTGGFCMTVGIYHEADMDEDGPRPYLWITTTSEWGENADPDAWVVCEYQWDDSDEAENLGRVLDRTPFDQYRGNTADDAVRLIRAWLGDDEGDEI